MRPSDDERIETMTKLMKDEKKDKEKLITQFYPDYEYEEKPEEKVTPRFKSRTKVMYKKC